jgi:predicted metal-binding membrane protein
MRNKSAIEVALAHDRYIVAAGLSLVVLAAAIYTVTGVGMTMSALTMTRMAIEMPGMAMQPVTWTVGYAFLLFLMWWVMMIAMMVPSAAPIVLIYSAICRKQPTTQSPLAATALFVTGYLAAWAGFSVLATGLQWLLESAGLMTGMMEFASPVLAGLILVLAGLYQLTPLKAACLQHCQHPLMFIANHWQPGAAGALRMGFVHGRYCLGCCWFLMALLFVGGVMNLIWIAGIAIYVGIEKFVPSRRWLTLSTGAVLTAAGLFLLARPFLNG